MAEQATSTPSQFVERMGLLWENEGLPRIAGRIFGFLATQGSPCSLDELASALDVSKASVSTDARRLESLGLIRRIGLPGDRRDYYEIAEDAPLRVLDIKLEGLARFGSALDDVADDPTLPSHVRARIRHFETLQQRILRVLTDLRSELGAHTLTASPQATSNQ